MIPAALPDNETERLEAVRRYDLLDTLPEEEFDDLTMLASHICNTPIALMTIVDTGRQWFKSRVGLDLAQTGRDVSFCGHAILGSTLFEVPDALDDPRFQDNPLVTGAPDVRFYAGTPLVSDDGYRLGTLCVVDTAPRTLSAVQRQALTALGRQVSRQLENRLRIREVLERTQFMDAVFHSTDVAIIGIDAAGTVTGFNRGAEDLLGYRAADLVGAPLPPLLFETAQPEAGGNGRQTARSLDVQALLQRSRTGARASGDWTMVHRAGSRVPVGVTLSPLLDAGGRLTGCLCIARDDTERRRAEAERELAQTFIASIAERVPGAICQFMLRPDGSFSFPFASEGIRDIYQVAPAEVRDDAAVIFTRIAAEDRDRVLESIRVSARTMHRWAEEYRVRRADGSIRWVLGKAKPQARPDGAVLWHGFLTDVTDRRRVGDALAESEARLRLITDNLPVLITYIDRERRFKFANATIEPWFGTTPAAVQGRRFEDVAGLAVHDAVRHHMARALAGERVEFEMPFDLDGTGRHLQAVYVPDRGPDGAVKGFYTLTTDVTRLKASEQRLARLARHDFLTGLPNRLQLNERMLEAIGRSRRSGHPIAIMYLDIDHFKTINDTYGHATGDAVLIAFAARLLRCVRETDTVGRLAGDEFVILLEGTHSAREPRLVAQKIIDSMATAVVAGSVTIPVHTSIGIACGHDGARSPADLLGIADRALYEAKKAGRNTFRAG